MNIKDKLQIILITYNRAKYVEKTLKQFFSENSPVKDIDFLVLSNNSSDNTEEVVKEWQKHYPNITYRNNKYNLGISGNIAKALEIANKDYVWIIGDDDIYDFSNWQEVEQAISNNEKLICISRYVIPDNKKNDVSAQLLQLTFITGAIYSTSLLNDTTIRNAFDNVYTLFPHMFIAFDFINEDGKIYVLDKAIADNGWKIEEKDTSYTRGSNISKLSEKSKTMTWILGYCHALSLLKDKTLISQCIETAVLYPDIYPNIELFYAYLNTIKNNDKAAFEAIYPLLGDKLKNEYEKYAIKRDFEMNPYKKVVINILGLKIKFKVPRKI